MNADSIFHGSLFCYYTNNSMGFQGAQSYEEFMDAYYIGDLEGNDIAASFHKIVTRYVGYYYTLDKEW